MNNPTNTTQGIDLNKTLAKLELIAQVVDGENLPNTANALREIAAVLTRQQTPVTGSEVSLIEQARDIIADLANTHGAYSDASMAWMEKTGDLAATHQATLAAPAEQAHELDAAMSLLRVARAIDPMKISPAKLRNQVIESISIAAGGAGEGEEYIYADVYGAIVDMIDPYVYREGLDRATHPFPSSVHDTVQMLLEHYLTSPPKPAASQQAGSVSDTVTIKITNTTTGESRDWNVPRAHVDAAIATTEQQEKVAPLPRGTGSQHNADPCDVIEFALELAENEGNQRALDFLTAWLWETNDDFLRVHWPDFAKLELAAGAAKGGTNNDNSKNVATTAAADKGNQS